MFPEKPPRPKRSNIGTEEERTWVEFYRRGRSDAALAAEVLVQLERDAEMKRHHLALYLCCKETLRREKARQARHKRISFFVRWLAYNLFAQPWRALRNFSSEGRDIAIEILPEPQRFTRQAARAVEPAIPLPSAAGAEKANPASS